MRVFTITVIVLLAGILIVFNCSDKTNQQSETKTSYIDSVYSADSVLIKYEVSGMGEKSLVFVHCWCCDRSYFENQTVFLSRDYKVVAIDLAGHGVSGINRDEWTISAYANDVAAVVNKLGLKDVVLIGHSMGGMIVMEAAGLLTTKIKAILGIDIYMNFDRNITPEQIEQYVGYFNEDFKNNTKTYVKQIFAEKSDSALIERISEDMSLEPANIGVSSMENILKFDYKLALGKLNIPVRGIHGDMNPTNLDGNKAVYADFEAVIIPETGHFPHLEKPELFNQELTKILKELWKDSY